MRKNNVKQKGIGFKQLCKRVTAISMSSILLMGSVSFIGCDKKQENASDKDKVETIRIQVGAGLVKNEEEGRQFEVYLEELLASYEDGRKVDIEYITPYHPDYFAGSSKSADIVIHPDNVYQAWAKHDLLWNMTDAWKETESRLGDRLSQSAKEAVADMYVLGNDNKKGLYGISPVHGNGCCTYVKADWLKCAGIDRSSVEGKTLTFDEYYDMLKKLRASSQSDYVISPPGFISESAPYTHYLPEFYQDAQYDFCKDETGKYVDGFAQPEMIAALGRIQKAVQDGIINKNATEEFLIDDAKALFTTPDAKRESGVFTYLAGRWANKASSEIEGKKRTDGTTMSGELVMLKPIAELGEYVTNKPGMWCITKDCKNPEVVYKYIIEPLFDGGDIQKAWQYGVKDVHWGDEIDVWDAHHVDSLCVIAPIKDDIGVEKAPELAKKSQEFFIENSKMYERLPHVDKYGENYDIINNARRRTINKVVTDPSYTPEQGIRDYEATVRWIAEDILKTLNELEE